MGASSSVHHSIQHPPKQTTSNLHKLHHANEEHSLVDLSHTLHIFFGSETGTANGFAKTLAKEGKAKGIDAKKCDLGEFTPDQMHQCRLAIFLMANMGDGEPTTNATNFYEWLENKTKSIPSDYLSNMHYCVFGLGNSTYKNFNKVGRETDAMLQKLGGKRVFPYAQGDDNDDLEGDFNAWKEKMWAGELAHLCEHSIAGQPNQKTALSYTAKLIAHDINSVPNMNPAHIKLTTKHYFTATSVNVTVNRELQSGSERSTKHIELALPTGFSYRTADNIGILAKNSESAVSSILSALGFCGDQYFELVGADPTTQLPFPSPCSVKDAIENYLDICGPLDSGTLSDLIPFVKDEQEIAWLKDIVSSSNQAQYAEFSRSGLASLTALLADKLKSCKIPFDDLINLIPCLQPRFYTIASSSTANPSSIHLCVGVTRANLRDGKVHHGVCSSYLASLKPGDNVRVFLRDSEFRLPDDLSKPIIMIGPGTGLAPMRALIQERAVQRSQTVVGTGCGSNILYFGCRRSDDDFIYRDELEGHVSSGVLDALHLAFSREGSSKLYVQDLIRRPENAAAVVRDLDSGGYVFVCGATAMGADVFDAIAEVIANAKGLSKEDASKVLIDMKSTGRYVQELWSAS